MSRHQIQPRDPAHKVIVGWDQPLRTYFAQVINRRREDAGKDGKFLFWIGCSYREIYELDELRRRIKRYAYLGEDVRTKLHADKDEGK